MALCVQSSLVARDAWFTPSLTGDRECDVIFLGDSQFRYLAEHITKANPKFVPGVYFRSGAKVEDLSGDHIAQLFSQKTRACVIHVGTNNLKSLGSSPSAVFLKLRSVLADIAIQNPKCEIFISSVIPRYVDRWDDISDMSTQHHKVKAINLSIKQYNDLVGTLCKANAHLHFVNHDNVFQPNGKGVQSNLLARDGLHLSKQGIASVAKALLCCLETFEFHKNKAEAFQSNSTPSHKDHSDSTAQVVVDSHAPLGSLDYPPLPAPKRKVGTKSPYQPADPSLVITKADLCKTSPWAAMLNRVTSHKKSNQPKPIGTVDCVRLPKVTKPATSAPSCPSVRIVRHKSYVKVKAESSIRCTNRFALLTVEDDSFDTVTANTCRSNTSVGSPKLTKKQFCNKKSVCRMFKTSGRPTSDSTKPCFSDNRSASEQHSSSSSSVSSSKRSVSDGNSSSNSLSPCK